MFRRPASPITLLSLLILAFMPVDKGPGASQSATPDEDTRAMLAGAQPEEHTPIVLNLRLLLLYSVDSDAITTTLTMQEISRVIVFRPIVSHQPCCQRIQRGFQKVHCPGADTGTCQ